MYKPTREQRAYIAGFIDGEGCVSITKAKKKRSANYSYALSLIVANVELEPLKLIQKYYGGFIVVDQRSHPTRKPRRFLRLSTHGTHRLLRELYNYFIIKKKHAEIAFIFMSAKNMLAPSPRQRSSPGFLKRQEWCKQQMHKLNHRGR